VVRRLTWMVDVFYDQKVKLICSAEAPPESLVLDDRVENLSGAATSRKTGKHSGAGASLLVSAEFARTASRLREMQSREYFSRKHASAENPSVLEGDGR